jgi:hypothetical protein
MDRLLIIVAAALTLGCYLTTCLLQRVDVNAWFAGLPIS